MNQVFTENNNAKHETGRKTDIISWNKTASGTQKSCNTNLAIVSIVSTGGDGDSAQLTVVDQNEARKILADDLASSEFRFKVVKGRSNKTQKNPDYFNTIYQVKTCNSIYPASSHKQKSTGKLNSKLCS